MKYSILFLFISLSSFGQSSFEKGYFINNNDQTIKCLIKKSVWKSNPTEFEYKLTINDTIVRGTLATVKEYGIHEGVTFLRFTVDIDRSPEETDNLSSTRGPVWFKEQLFLKLLVKGKASLYYYSQGNLVRFFYSIEDSIPRQLVFKSYLYNGGHIGTNNAFRQQLWNDVNVPGITLEKAGTIDYDENELVTYFRDYNRATGGDSVIIHDKYKYKTYFHVILAPGLNYSGFSMFNSMMETKITFSNQAGLRLGLNIEVLLPFNKNKWGVEFEPTYQNFISSTETKTSKVSVNYNSIEFPLGLRYYSILNPHLRLFFDVFITFPFCLNMQSKVRFDNDYLNLKSKGNFAAGTGITYRAFSFEFRFYARQDLLTDYLYWTSRYQRCSFILGCKIF